MLKNAIKHFGLITKHKWIVFKLCCKAGIPWRGLVHDLSKYSPTEFFESIKYYTGTHSPITEAKRNNGYSKAWLHHKGRNRHHAEYWEDYRAPIQNPVIPYKYVVEMVCDTLAAGIVYSGKNWTNDTQLNYWNREKINSHMNEKTQEFLTNVYLQVSEKGINKVVNKKNLQSLYGRYCEDKNK